MSLVARPEVQVLPGFAGTDMDEMSFNYLKTIPAYVESFNWGSTDSTNAQVYSKQVSPVNLSDLVTLVTSGGSYTAEYAPPAFHLSEYFRYYRGSVRVHLKIIKTDFHSGRLQVCYTPEALGNGNVAPTTTADAQFSLREIVDIRERSEIVIELPYLSNTNYIDVGSSIGFLDIRVLNELRAPSTAAQSVRVLVYYSGGDDFELAGPKPVNSRVITPQSGLDRSTIQTAKPIGNLVHKDHNTEFASTAMGDSFTSVKQLILKYCRFAGGRSATGTVGVATWFFSNDSTVPNTAGPSHDMLSAMSGGYLLARGSLRYAFVSAPTTSQRMEASYVMLSPNTLTTISGIDPNFSSVDPNSTQFNCGLEVAFQDTRGGTEVIVPYYNKTLSSLITYSVQTSLATDPSTPNGRLSHGINNECANMLVRAAGDDFQFGYFIGFAPFSRAFVPL